MKKPPRTNELLRRARQEQGWTQRRLGRELSVDEQTVRSWELGTRFPSLQFRSQLCALFCKPPEELGLQLTEKEEPILQQSPPTALPIDPPQLTVSPLVDPSPPAALSLDPPQVFCKPPEELGLQLTEKEEPILQQSPPTALPIDPPQLTVSPLVDPSSPAALSLDSSLPSPSEERGIEGDAVPSLQEGSLSLALHQVDENRQRMLGRVHSLWITGVLEHSLYRATLIELGLQEQPDAVENPWHLAVQESELPPRSLPEGTRITQVFDEADGQLLILGEPGAGKTTLLLELARDLLDRAETNQSHPIPVIFDLSSWAIKHLPLAEWVAEELESKYRVPRQIGRAWIDSNQLLLLLDSLDEVAETARATCLEAINTYQQTHAFGPLVVCCRREEYEEISTRVALQQAIVVQPLTREQVDAYLWSTGGQLEGVRRALEDDPQMREMITTPLMLNIVTLVYQGKANAPFPIASSLDARRERVFTLYVKRMLARRGAKTRYSQEQTVHWLAWLARQLEHQNQTIFSLEQIQPDWLADGWLRRFYRHVVTWLLYGLIFAVGAAVCAWFRGKTPTGFGGDLTKRIVGWVSGGQSGPGGQILGWMARGLGGGFFGGTTVAIVSAVVSLLVLAVLCRADTGGTERTRTPLLQAVLSEVKDGVLAGGIGGLLLGLVCQVFFGWTDGLIGGLGYGVVGGLLVGLLSGVTSALEGQQMSLVAAPSAGGRLLRRIGLAVQRVLLVQWVDRFVIALLSGLGFGIVSSLLGGLKSGLISGLGEGVITFLLLGLGAIPGFGGRRGGGLVAGLGIQTRPVEMGPWSWMRMLQGLFKNLKDGAVIGLAAMSSITIGFALMSGLFYGIPYAIAFGLTFGLISGLMAWLIILLFGGLRGWSSMTLDEQTDVRSQQGIQRAMRHGLLAAMIGGISSGLISGVVSAVLFLQIGRLSWAPALGVAYGLVFGVICAVLFWLAGGGRAWMERVILRFLLWCTGCAPLDYPAFLDYAVERILLRKMGDGYTFIHRLLLEYFVSCYTEKPSSSRKRSGAA